MALNMSEYGAPNMTDNIHRQLFCKIVPTDLSVDSVALVMHLAIWSYTACKCPKALFCLMRYMCKEQPTRLFSSLSLYCIYLPLQAKNMEKIW